MTETISRRFKKGSIKLEKYRNSRAEDYNFWIEGFPGLHESDDNPVVAACRSMIGTNKRIVYVNEWKEDVIYLGASKYTDDFFPVIFSEGIGNNQYFLERNRETNQLRTIIGFICCNTGSRYLLRDQCITVKRDDELKKTIRSIETGKILVGSIFAIRRKQIVSDINELEKLNNDEANTKIKELEEEYNLLKESVTANPMPATSGECEYGVSLAPYRDETPNCERRKDKREKQEYERLRD
jgi:hypothetical protein